MNVVLHDSQEAYDREYQHVRAAFIASGTTLQAWLVANGVDRQLAYRALKGRSFGKRAIAVRGQILRQANALAKSS